MMRIKRIAARAKKILSVLLSISLNVSPVAAQFKDRQTPPKSRNAAVAATEVRVVQPIPGLTRGLGVERIPGAGSLEHFDITIPAASRQIAPALPPHQAAAALPNTEEGAIEHGSFGGIGVKIAGGQASEKAIESSDAATPESIAARARRAPSFQLLIRTAANAFTSHSNITNPGEIVSPGNDMGQFSVFGFLRRVIPKNGSKNHPIPSGSPGEPSKADKELLELREKVEQGAYDILRSQVGGDIGRPEIYAEIRRMLRRIQVANGIDPNAASLYYGNSFIPNAFTTITDAEITYLKEKGRLKANFKNSNIFLSHGLTETFLGQPDAALAFVLAHELAHNRLGHLKTLFGSFAMLGHFLEFDADIEALRMIARAGFDPRQALDALEIIEDRVDALSQKYALLRRTDSEIQALLARWRDIHPPHAQRRAKLEKHLAEALEIYNSSPYKNRPNRFMARINTSLQQKPIENSFNRFETKAASILADETPTFYDKLLAIETLIVQRVHRVQQTIESGEKATVHLIRLEDQLVVENVFRALAKSAKELADLNNLYQMYVRLKKGYGMPNFPSHKAHAAIISSQIRNILRTLGPLSPPSHLQEFVGGISTTALHSLLLIYLKRIDSAVKWEEALYYLGNHAQTLGLVPGAMEPSMARDIAKTLLDKTLALSIPTDLTPNERLARAIEALFSKLPSTLLAISPTQITGADQYLSTHLKAEVVDLYLTGKLSKDSPWGVPALSLLLQGKSRQQIFSQDIESFYREIVPFGVMEAWNKRYYAKAHLDVAKSGKILFNYEKNRDRPLAMPEPADLLTLLFIFPHVPEEWDHLSRFGYLSTNMPEAISDEILQRDISWQERFWMEATDFMLEVYAKRFQFSDADRRLEEGMRHLGSLQKSVLERAQGLAPTVAVLNGTSRALHRHLSKSTPEVKKLLSKLADIVINGVVNEHVARQLDKIRFEAAGIRGAGESGISPEEFATLTQRVLDLDRDYSSFNTTERLRTLASAMYRATVSGENLITLTAYVRPISVHSSDTGSSGYDASAFIRENEKLFRRAGLEEEFKKLPGNLQATLTSGALGLIADPQTTVSQLLGASLAAYYKHQARIYVLNDTEETDLIRQSLAYLLLEEAGRRIRTREDARAAADFLSKIHDIDPLYLSYMPRFLVYKETSIAGNDTPDVNRSELLAVLAAKKQPFRELDAAVMGNLLQAIRKFNGWPERIGDQLKLLDWAARSGDYDDSLDQEVIRLAERDPAGFQEWMKQDGKWTESIRRTQEKFRQKNRIVAFDAFNTVIDRIRRRFNIPARQFTLPKLHPAPLRIIRNPVTRAALYSSVKNIPFLEKVRHNYWRERKVLLNLCKAILKAKYFFSKYFLKQILREANADARIIMVYQEVSLVAEKMTRNAAERWEAGKPTKYDHLIFNRFEETLRRNAKERHSLSRAYIKWLKRSAKPRMELKWAHATEKEKKDYTTQYSNWVFQRAMEAIYKLGDLYSAFMDPELGFILDNFPEPNRVRDDLLERLAKSRSLLPERLSVIESYKSYRYPNPLRFAEKQFLEAATIQLNKLSPAERVDLTLHLGGARRLSDQELRRFELKILGRDRRRLMRKEAGIYSFTQLLRYMDQLHPNDKELFVRAMFYGKNSISEEPEQIERLYRAVAIEGRDLPMLVEKILVHYFDILSLSERVNIIVALVKAAKSGQALTGPDVVYLALKNGGITGAKIAQVLSTHRGMLPEEYAKKLEDFKDAAQEEVEKARVLNLLEQKFALLLGQSRQMYQGNDPKRHRELEAAAKFLYPRRSSHRREKYIQEVLALERITTEGGLVSDIKQLGMELGSGSIKIVYKVTLKDGSAWVAKLRRPGATVIVEREFEIIHKLIDKLLADPDLRLPNLNQLFEEVRELVMAEMNFEDEATKSRVTEKNVAGRKWLANLAKKGGRAIIPEIHPKYVDEDVILEEYFPSVSFKNLPERSLVRTSKRDLAKAIMDEASQALILDEYLDPDRHSGNVLKRLRSWWMRMSGLNLFGGAKPIWIDLGQSVSLPLNRTKPLLQAGLAMRYGRIEIAANNLSMIFALEPGQSRDELNTILRTELAVNPGQDLMNRIVSAVMKAEKQRYIVHKEYAALEKALLLLNGYGIYLPRNYFVRSLEQAVQLRILREKKPGLARLAWCFIADRFLGQDHYSELEQTLESLGSSKP